MTCQCTLTDPNGTVALTITSPLTGLTILKGDCMEPLIVSRYGTKGRSLLFHTFFSLPSSISCLINYLEKKKHKTAYVALSLQLLAKKKQKKKTVAQSFLLKWMLPCFGRRTKTNVPFKVNGKLNQGSRVVNFSLEASLLSERVCRELGGILFMDT